MASVTDIANLALSHLGEPPITDLDSATKPAPTLKANYPLARDTVLRLHAWNCAIYRAALSQTGTAPGSEFGYQYTLPAGATEAEPYCLRALYVVGESIRWRVENRTIVADDSGPLYLVYVGRPPDPELFDSLLATTIGLQLAMQAAYAISGSRSAQETMAKLLKERLAQARGVDGTEGFQRTADWTDWTGGRLV